MSNTFVVVEGPQDSEFIAQLFKRMGFAKVRMLDQLESFFCRQILSTDYPVDGDLYARMPTPMYMRRENDWVAIRSAGGTNEHLLKATSTALQSLRAQPDELDAIAIIRDADDQSAAQCFGTLMTDFQSIQRIDGYSMRLPESPGEISNGSPRMGAYILPDNRDRGALETLLHDCGNEMYPDLMQGAGTFVDRVDMNSLNRRDAQLIKKPFGRQKATVACVADILKPGMSIQTSIDQNRWVCDQSASLPRVASLFNFLSDLVGEVV